ncbi:non-ribosomal peptide synthetase [Microbulbifer halophilus]|uniref:Non-ribosomal peptide synthetase n=1 Tax=Microbulbifer halophilus TaxID=453963 RepID=A0ABW5EHJ1_9GAMM|nr:non-ribosomal peptide synthetase [Microbulbifer halophilus]MCW8128235.1 amino acid adenylation domain-containing protein [Microbulbifer halophilus]
MDSSDTSTPTLSPKQRLAAELRQRRERRADAGASIQASERTHYRLSPQQRRLWFLEQVDGPNSAYTMATALHLRGCLDTPSLARAVRDLCRRHRVLDSIVELVDGEPMQRPLDRSPALRVIDLAGLPEKVSARALEAIKHQVIAHPFRMDRDGFLRADMVVTASDESILLLTMHHVAADGWSLNLLVRDLLTLYQAGIDSEIAQLPPLQIQYGDYAEWLHGRKNLQESDVLYWKARLEGAPPLLELPCDRSRPAVPTRAGECVVDRFPAKLRDRVQAFASDREVTVFAVLTAAFGALMARLAGCEEVVLGTPLANRDRAELAQMIGFFANSVPLRLRTRPGQDAATLVRDTQATLLEALDHASAPLEAVVESLALPRSLAHAPIFQVMFGLNNATELPDTVELPQLSASIEPLPVAGAKFDLSVSYNETGSGLVGYWEFSRDLFDRGTIEAFRRRYLMLIDRMLDMPECPVLELPLVAEEEGGRLREWSCGPVAPSVVHPLADFSACVKARPDSIAVTAGDNCLSYAQLDRSARRIASGLRRQGSGPGRTVAVILERDQWLPAMLLAVWMTGAAYVPIDPRLPARRVGAIVEDSGACALIASRPFADMPDPITIDTLSDTAPLPGYSEKGQTQLAPAYVIYTSGTTGKPKGVVVDFAALANLLAWHAGEFSLDSSSRASVLAGVGFDALGWELWPNLLHGGGVEMVDQQTLEMPSHLVAFLAERCITHCFMPTPLAELVGARLDRVRHLQTLLVGGDRLSRLRDGTPYRLVNNYGPTEATVVSTSGDVDAGQGRAPSIGRPIAGLSAHVLDAAMGPQPVGVVGELYVGGIGLAQCYLAQPELTAKSFLPDPFAGIPGARLYRTGDLVRWRSDGSMEFVGRADTQIKLRGFRIEAGEIESQLMAVPSVAQASVRLLTDPVGQRQLVAYFAGDQGTSTEALRQHLEASLPDYMLPSLFMQLDEMPLTANGKLDYDRFPEPLWSSRGREEQTPPKGVTEVAVAELWSELLGVSGIGREDTFFELGGHSMLAAKMLDITRERFGTAPSLKDLWAHPAVAAFAAHIDKLAQSGKSARDEDALPRIAHDAARRYEPFPLTDIQQAYWLGRSDAFEIGNVAAHAYSEHELHAGEFSIELFEDAVNRLIDRHDVLRMIVQDDGLQRTLRGPGRYLVPFRDLRELDPAAREAALLTTREEMSHHVFDPKRWPLFDLRVDRIAADHYRLYWSFDGLVLDGFSQQILVGELMTLLFEPNASLPPLSINFRDYVVGLEALRKTDAYRRSEAYWMEQLETFPGAPELPLAMDPSRVRFPRFVRREFCLPAAQWKEIKRVAGEWGITASGVLLRAFADVLQCWSKTPDFALNLTTFNRLPLHPEVDRLLGDFTSLTLLRTEFISGVGFGERAQALQQRLWDDLEHRYFDGTELIRELRRHRGDSVGMPIVFSSMLGMEMDSAPADPNSRQDEAATQRGFAVSQTSQVWIDHQVSELDGALYTAWDVVDALFPTGMLDAMLDTYRGLLERLATERAAWTEVSSLPLPPAQRVARRAANSTSAPWTGTLLHAGLEARAACAPEALAVWSSARQLSYGQLRKLARHYGHALRSAGAQPGELVGVVMRKGWEQVVAVQAVLESGAAYLPIDADLPAARIEQLLDLGEVKRVLTQPGPEAEVAWPGTPRRWVVNADALAAEELPALSPVQTLETLAYVIFTSGSTGRPKGVMIDHRGSRNTIDSINAMLEVGSDDRVLAVSSLSFDLSVYDLFGLLSAGGTVVIPDVELEKDPAHWSRLLSSAGVTVWNTVPALMQLLVEYHEQRELPLSDTLREVMLSGDWIPVGLPDRIKALAPQVRVRSLGGATEASIWSIHYLIDRVDPAWTSIPYGYPLANQSYQVLKEDLSPCPDWVPGDLYIGGIGLAQGYWRDAEKTAASFVTVAGERLYRTGDLGRYLPDGSIEFLGREDSQVKVQGYRVELGEIEVALLRQPLVREAVVAALGEAAHHKRLVGYVVLESGPGGGPAPAEQALFKLSRPGLRVVADAGIDLPRPADALGLSWALPQGGGQAPGFSALANWLGALRATPVEEAPLPKYFYPSSGSLNPIRAYLEVGEGLAELPRGVYYYDPVDHRLQRIGDGGAAGMRLHLVAAQQAVEPLYGAEGVQLCQLEAGYVLALLQLAAPVQGIDVRVVETDAPEAERLGLEETEQLLTSLTLAATQVRPADLQLELFERQSYRRFAGRELTTDQFEALLSALESPAGLTWYAQATPGSVEGLRAGYYLLEPATGRCRLLEASDEVPRERYAGAAGAAYAQNALAIYAVGTPEPGLRLASGMQGQRLSVAGVKEAVGVCPIGGFKAPGLAQRLGAEDGAEVVHSWLLGAIDVEQTRRWEQEPAPASPMEQLREALAETLPGYMVPSTLVPLERIPLTPNGKVDRRALPAPAEPLQRRQLRPPRTRLEETLVAIWREVLGLEEVGIDDHFFEIGGDSVHLVQMQTRLRSSLGADVSLRELYAHPELAELAVQLERRTAVPQRTSAGPETGTVPLRRSRHLPVKGPHPLSAAQYRIWFADRIEGSNVLFNFPSLLHFESVVGVDMLRPVFETVIRRHLVLTARFEEEDGQPFQYFEPDLVVRIPVIDLESLPDDCTAAELERLRIEESRRTFNLSTGPLFHIQQVRCGPSQSQLFLNKHHIVSDGWSGAIFIRELLECFAAAANDRPANLPPLEIQYSDFVYWQQERLAMPGAAESLAWWQRRLADLPTLRLPLDRARQTRRDNRGLTVSRMIDGSLVESLRAIGQKVGGTLFAVLLAAFKLLLSRYDGRQDIVVGTSAASRPSPELEQLVGLFVNQLALRTSLEGNPSFSELVRRVSQTTTDALAHQEVPFDRVVAAAAPSREPGLSPLFQVLFLLNNMPKQELGEVAGVSVRSQQIHSGAARFDLSLTLEEQADGFRAEFEYRSDIFDDSTGQTLADRYLAVLARAADAADRPIADIEIHTDAEREERADLMRRHKTGSQRFRSARRQAIDIGKLQLVQESMLDGYPDFPLVFSPATSGVELTEWAASERESIEKKLHRHGALLFRGFGIDSVERFERFALSVCPDLVGDYGDLPKEVNSRRVYKSTPYPEDKTILFHNESSHTHRWPMKQFFGCIQAAQKGGETPLVDCRELYRKLDPSIANKLASQGLLYVRNFIEGLDVSWQDFFRTDDRAAVEAQLRSLGTEFVWTGENNLRIRQPAQAITRHPGTGEPVFFNQIQLHHVGYMTSSERDALRELFAEEDLPRNVYYGDGSEIETEVTEAIDRLYRENAVAFPWQQGDVLMVDNMLVAHGRYPFSGPRKVIVAMGEMTNASDLAHLDREAEESGCAYDN